MLLEHPADQLSRCQGLDLLDDEAVSAHDPAAPHVQHLHRGYEIVLGDGEDVQILRRIGDHLLASDGKTHGGQPVTKARRPLELELPGRFAHLGLEAVDDRLCVPVEKCHELGHEPLVLVGLDCAYARPGAPFDVVEQARPAEKLMAPELGIRAGPDWERPQEQVERLTDGVGVGIRTEIARVLAPGASHDGRLGPLVADGDREVGIALVVD